MIFDEVSKFYKNYQYKKCVIGYSCSGKEIFAFHVGQETGRQFIAVYAVHAREWITARLALKHIKKGISSGGGWIIPLLNPDGVLISETAFPLWKANGRGVDLNCNFDADWGSGRLNTRVRGGENCIGDYPFSEPETIALREFTLKIRPFVTLSFHTKGEEIYYEYGGRGDLRGAQIINAVTGYEIKRIFGSAGGYKDWCIKKLKIPAYTIECGSDELAHPITEIKHLKKCYKLIKVFSENYGK
ncbi:MAG: hypothetical protein K2O89_05975 [Clostridia bacterium]|nr:hypothetical protein [Clostridia bacterium]